MMRSFAIIGGDLRQTTLAKLLQKDGYDVVVYGFDKDMEYSGLNAAEDLKSALACDVIILPVPVSYDGKTINAPFSDHDIFIEDVLSDITASSIVLGGKISDYFIKQLEYREVSCCDYLKREELSVKNAIPTAEGAIQIAMEETPFTLWGSKCLIIGYGRIGKVLSAMLKGMGAEVSVSARKCADIAWIEERGYCALQTNEIKEELGSYDVIFNTVPAMMLNKKALAHVRPDALIIDLASKPGGDSLGLG